MMFLYLTLMVFLHGISYIAGYPTGAILVNDDYPRCKNVDFHTQRLVCEIHSQEDEMKIERFGLSGCYGSTLSCAEGDIKTCMPLMTINTLHYQCHCHSDEEGTTINYNHYWSSWQMLNERFRKFRYNRQLMIDNGNNYVAEEFSRNFPSIFYIVANNSLPDYVYNASSEYQWGGHGVERARIDNYFNSPCTWAADSSDPYPWVKISLPTKYTIKGVYIKRRCDNYGQYPAIVDVMTSEDDVMWQEILVRRNITTSYSSNDSHGFVNIWFPHSYTTKYWKIFIFKFVSHASMKCDLLGY